MKKHILFLCIFTISLNLFSQDRHVSGFLGKKNLISFNPGVGFAFKPIFGVKYERVITKHGLIALNYVINKDRFRIPLVFNNNVNSPVQQDREQLAIINNYTLTTDNAIALDYKFFTKKNASIAPVGTYFGLGVIRHAMHFDLSENTFTFRDDSNNYPNIEDYDIPAPNPKINITRYGAYCNFGMQRAISNHFIIGVGGKLELLLDYDAYTINQTGNLFPFNDWIEKSLVLWQTNNNIFRLNINVGYVF